MAVRQGSYIPIDREETLRMNALDKAVTVSMSGALGTANPVADEIVSAAGKFYDFLNNGTTSDEKS